MVSKEDAETELKDYAPSIRACIVYGWDKWQELAKVAGHLRAPLRNRTRANFISDHIADKVRATFTGMRRIRIVESRGMVELIIDNRYVLRFKKLDKNGRSRNILTRQQRRWFEGQLMLPEMPLEAERLIAGYVLDELGTAIKYVLVTCPVGVSNVEWMIDLPDNGGLKVIEMQPRRDHPTPPPVSSTLTSVKDSEDA